MLVEEILDNGKRNKTNALDQAVDMALQDPNRLEEVVAFLFSSKPNIAARAAWVLRKVAEENTPLVLPFKDYLLEHLDQDLIWEVRAELCHVLPSLQPDEQELPILIRFFEEGLNSSSRIVVTWSMNALFELSKTHHPLKPKLEALVEAALQSEYPAVRARARAITRALKKNP